MPDEWGPAMTAPPQRRPLPAVVFIAILTVLTAIVWVRVLGDDAGAGSAGRPGVHHPGGPDAEHRPGQQAGLGRSC